MWGDVMQKEIEINTPFITLGQLLKEEGIIGTGGHDVIEVPDEGSFKITTKSGK